MYGKRIARVVLPGKSKQQVERELRSQETSLAADARFLKKTVDLLQRYFSGELVSLDLPIDVHANTAFQQEVWMAAASIPRGETRSYAWIAKQIKRPKAARAVGQALGANPIPLFIP